MVAGHALFMFADGLKIVDEFHMLDLFVTREFGKEPAEACNVNHLPHFLVPFVPVLDVLFEVRSIDVIT